MAVAADCADAEPVRGAHLDVYLRKLLGEAVVNRTVDDEGICTATSIAQTKCEAECCLSLAPFVVQPPTIQRLQFDADERPMLMRELHRLYLLPGLVKLPSTYTSMDSSRPWFLYWTVHALDLLEKLPTDPALRERLAGFVPDVCQIASGGIAGGPGQVAHLAAGYAGSLAMMVLGSGAAYSRINRGRLYCWLMARKSPRTGSLHVHFPDGEADCRSVYTALIHAYTFRLVTAELVRSFAWFLRACQTHEGGFAGEPGGEAHGAYTYCSTAALCLVRGWGTLEDGGGRRVLRAFLWQSRRQMQLEGGFQGRTHKLVDGCYTWWHGGAGRALQVAARQVLRMPPANPDGFEGLAAALPVAVVESALAEPDWARGAASALDVAPALLPSDSYQAVGASATVATATAAPLPHTLSAFEAAQLRAIAEGELLPFDAGRLQTYVLRCCQQANGGLRDKPSVNRDAYHTCYCLSGLSAAQHDAGGRRIGSTDSISPAGGAAASSTPATDEASCLATHSPAIAPAGVEGAPTNAIPAVDVLCNVRIEHSAACARWHEANVAAPDHSTLIAEGESAAAALDKTESVE